MVDLGSEGGSKAPLTLLADFLEVFRWRKLWGVYIGQFSVTTAQWFFLTWFPTYLKKNTPATSIMPRSGFRPRCLSWRRFSACCCRDLFPTASLRSGASLGVALQDPDHRRPAAVLLHRRAPISSMIRCW